MMQNDSQNQEIKRYLFLEMTDEERTAWEEKFFTDDELFFEIADTENRLVDFYARGRLDGEELKRFERSLSQLPQRRAKIANAVALQTFFDEERKESVPVVVGQTFWQKLAEFFTIKTPAFGYAMGGLLFLFLLSSVFLFLENRRQSNELARLQNTPDSNQSQREIDLQNQLANTQTRENELQTSIDSEREASGDLGEELEKEKTRRERIQSELDKLRKERDRIPAPTPKIEQAPIIASIFLTPLKATRGVSGLGAKDVAVERGTKRIAVRLALPDEIDNKERLSVRLNDKASAQNLAVRVSSGGQKSVQLTVSPADLIDGTNKLTVVSADGREVSRYLFNTIKK